MERATDVSMASEQRLVLKRIKELLKRYFTNSSRKFYPGKTKIGVSGSVFDEDEVYGAVQALQQPWKPSQTSLMQQNLKS